MTDVVSVKPWIPDGEGLNAIFVNCSIVNTENGTVQGNSSFRVRNGKFEGGSPIAEPQGVEVSVIDLAGKFVCPGLIDCHVHMNVTPGAVSLLDTYNVAPSTIAYRTTHVARQMLLRGFTTARDTGGADAALRDAIAEGLIPGPRLFIAGKALSQTGGHGDIRRPYQDDAYKCCGGHTPNVARICDGVPQCLAAARDELRQGSDFLKIMCGGGVASPTDPLEMVQFTKEEIQAVTVTARNSGTYVTAHAYTVEAIRHAVDNGVRGIEHANFIDADTARYCVEKGVVFTPTLITYEAMMKPSFASLLPASGQTKLKQVICSGLASLKILKDAGAIICHGSDLLGGLHPFQNEEFSVRARVLSPKDILQSATVIAAKYLGKEGSLGVLKDGAIADFLVLERNPLEDITILDRMKDNLLVIAKEGRVVASKLGNLEPDVLYRTFEL